MHIDRVSKTGSYSDPPTNILPHVTDVSIAFLNKDLDAYTGKAYRPLLTKILARYPLSNGQRIWQNSDNTNMYALAEYVQAQLGNIHPNHLVVTEENIKEPSKAKTFPVANRSLGIEWSGTNEISWQMVSQLNTCADDGDLSVVAATVSITATALASDYYASYISALVIT